MQKILPPQIREIPPTAKLVWLYIDRYPGRHSVRSLEAALGVVGTTVLTDLVAAGLLIELDAPAGRKLGEYRTAKGAELERSKPFIYQVKKKEKAAS